LAEHLDCEISVPFESAPSERLGRSVDRDPRPSSRSNSLIIPVLAELIPCSGLQNSLLWSAGNSAETPTVFRPRNRPKARNRENSLYFSLLAGNPAGRRVRGRLAPPPTSPSLRRSPECIRRRPHLFPLFRGLFGQASLRRGTGEPGERFAMRALGSILSAARWHGPWAGRWSPPSRHRGA